MPQDAITLKRLAGELNNLFSGAKVNKVSQPSADEVVLSLYSKHGNARLIVSVNAVGARVGITSIEQSNPTTPPSFCMLLRKHVTNATISHVSAIQNERIICIEFDEKNDFMEPVSKQLYCEIMGKYSNAIFCENNIIAGTLKPGVFDIGKERVLLSGAKYVLPHAQEKMNLYDKDGCIATFTNFTCGDFGEYVFRTIVGLSVQTANELVFRFFGKTSFENPITEPARFYDFMLNFLNSSDIKPCVVKSAGKLIDYFFDDYNTVSGERVFFDYITDAETFFFDEKKRIREKNELKNKLLSVVNSVLKKERKKLIIINDKLLACEDSERTRQLGELITANIYKIKRGDKQVSVVDYYNGNKLVNIPLDGQLSPNQNAQKYFKKYTKLKNTVKAVEPQKRQAEEEIDYALSILAEIEAADDVQALNFVREELIECGYIQLPTQNQTKKNFDKAKYEFRNFEYGEFKIRAGKNNIQNDKLTFSSKPSDCWLHVKDYHSAHVVIESNGKHIPEEIICIAAEICAYYSEAKNGSKVAVDYTLKKYVKKPPKAKYGSVIYTDFKTIIVTPESHSNMEIKS